MKELLASIGLSAVTAIGREQLIDLFGKIRQNNTPELYANAVKSTHSTFSMVADLAAKTKTKVDDAIVSMIVSAMVELAGEAGIEL